MGEEKEPKPKKAFEIKVVVWDDGEIDSELYEYRQNPSGRGAPGKWRLNKTDFVRRIEETLANPASNLLEDVYDMVGRDVANTEEIKSLVASTPAATPVESKDEKESEDYTVKTEDAEEKPKRGRKKKESAEEPPDTKDPDTPPDDNGSMDFGDFDNK